MEKTGVLEQYIRLEKAVKSANIYFSILILLLKFEKDIVIFNVLKKRFNVK
ncbi:MAG TPA: hypothetical protein PK447_08300 [Ignavibacteria bacterium]|nr:hypothetical protein [Ignavibacteria bacterium]